MKILITGNMGYVGPGVVCQLRSTYPNATIVGYDLGFFAHCVTGVRVLPETLLDFQVFGDVRTMPSSFLEGFDAVVHLAAISNDPMGKTFEAVTDEVNCQSSIRIAKMAKMAGVKNYVFASSCSVYGAADDKPRKEDDVLNPLTAYARSKVGTEDGIKKLASDDFVVTSLRFATACGMSARLRLDLVLNDFVAGAITSNTIDILSDGTPWRPLIHVKDMARAIDWAVARIAPNGGDFISINAGSDTWNYQVKDLAYAVAEALPLIKITLNIDAPPDKRSYKVDFSSFQKLAPEHQPLMSLEDTVHELIEGITRMGLKNKDYRNTDLIRLKVLNDFRADGMVSGKLAWN